MIDSSYRLHRTVFDDETRLDSQKKRRNPKTVYYISAEGARTEANYFSGVNKMLGNSDKAIVVLGRRLKSGEASVERVIGLMDEYNDLKEGDCAFPKEMVEEFGLENLIKFRNEKQHLDPDVQRKIADKVEKLEIDLEYRHFLSKYHGEDGNDQFCLLLDRDSQTHSRKQIEDCIDYCRKKGYRLFLNYLCFELWLLLHISDVAVEFEDEMDMIKENAKVSNKHTYVSKLLSEKCHHGKRVHGFEARYKDHICDAIEHSKKLATSLDMLIDNVGSNMYVLMEELINPIHSNAVE